MVRIMKKLLPILMSVFPGLVGCGVHSLDANGVYPTTIFPLPAAELQKLKHEYVTLNNFPPCMSLNAYGLPEWSLCSDRQILRKQIADAEKMHGMAKAFLLKNRKFTNVTDTTSIVFQQSDGLRGCVRCDGSAGDIVYIGWRAVLGNQVYSGLEVKNTTIFVWMDAEKVHNMAGNWFRDIHVPEQDRVSGEQARNSLIGKEITWSDFGGQQRVFVVTEDAVGNASRRVIIPYEKDQKIELRVTWEISISEGLWYAYIDTSTGEAVRIEQRFET